MSVAYGVPSSTICGYISYLLKVPHADTVRCFHAEATRLTSDNALQCASSFQRLTRHFAVNLVSIKFVHCSYVCAYFYAKFARILHIFRFW